MSINPRTALAWLVSVALMAACSPALAAGHGGGGGGGGFHGGGGFGGGGFHGGGFGGGGFHSAGSFGGHANFQSGNIGHWNMGTPYIASRPAISGNFHTGSFAVHNGNWNWGRTSFWHSPHFGWNDWWRYGYVRPWIGLGWSPGYYDYGYGYPYYYGYDYPYYGNYDYSYDVAPYTVETETPVVTETPVETETPVLASSDSSDFHAQAIEAFQQGDYHDAVRLATHAIIDDPKNADDHLLLSLALFAVGQYRGAAMEAHSVVALGGTPDWPMVASIYNNNVDPYTQQLRALEKFVRDNKTKPEGRFLLGFQYMIDGHRAVARDQLLEALKLTPRDNLAAQLLTKEGGTIPAEIAKQLESARHMPSTSGMGSSTTK